MRATVKKIIWRERLFCFAETNLERGREKAWNEKLEEEDYKSEFSKLCFKFCVDYVSWLNDGYLVYGDFVMLLSFMVLMIEIVIVVIDDIVVNIMV